uniref:SIX homeobox 4 n=1 Tax=Laticauda laticaudata TaxID=8630 RepID=A0A8C5WX18_LATLA
MSSASPTTAIPSLVATIKQENVLEMFCGGAIEKVTSGGSAPTSAPPPRLAAAVAGEEGSAAAGRVAGQVLLHSELLVRNPAALLAFSPDHVLASARLCSKAGTWTACPVVLWSLPQSDLLRGNERPAESPGVVAFHQGLYAELYGILESHTAFDAANPPSPAGALDTCLGAFDKYRLRRKFPLPREIANALKELYKQNRYLPRPRSALGQDHRPLLTQVSNWFKNRRQRDRNPAEPQSKSESDGNPSTEDESSKGQEDLSPRSLASTSDGGTSLSLPSPMEQVYMQQLGNSKISLSSSGVLLNGNLMPPNPSVFLNGTSFIQGPNGLLLNGLGVGSSQALSSSPLKTSPHALSNGVSMGDMLVPSSEDVKDFKLLPTSLSNSIAPSTPTTTYSPNSGPVSFPGLTPSMEVKREESEEAIASQDSGSVVTFTTPIQINQYGIVQIPNSTNSGQLLNGGLSFSPMQLPSVSAATSRGSLSINQGTSSNGTFTTDSTTAAAQQGKVFFSSFAPSTVVYTIPNTSQAVEPVKQEGLETSLVFSQVMPLGQNAQLHANLPSDNLPNGVMQPGGASSSLVNVTISHNFSLGPPSLLNGEELNSAISESPPMQPPTTSGPTVVSINNANYATLQNCSLISSHDLVSISPVQPALTGIGGVTSNDIGSHSSLQGHPHFTREQRLILQSIPTLKENFLSDSENRSGSSSVMLDSKTKYVTSNIVDAICEELGTDKKQLAKLQTVQMEEDMQDL